MSNHHLGPWIAKSDDGRYNNSRNTWRVDDEEACCSEAAPITLGDGTVIAFAVASDDNYFTDNRVDDIARLIAAAPDLLIELRQSIIQMEMAAECIEQRRYDEALLHVSSMLRSKKEAIAKATGESE